MEGVGCLASGPLKSREKEAVGEEVEGGTGEEPPLWMSARLPAFPTLLVRYCWQASKHN